MSSMKLLIIEDDHTIADSLKKGLTQESYITDVSYDGENGLDLATSGDYDLVILDLMLPKLDGTSVCQGIRKEGLNVPVLILTAKDRVKNKVELLNIGADDYLTKPFAFEELLARVRALARRPQALASDSIKVADLSLNTQNFEVTRAGNRVALSSKEYALLEYLMRNAEKKLSPKTLSSDTSGTTTPTSCPTPSKSISVILEIK